MEHHPELRLENQQQITQENQMEQTLRFEQIPVIMAQAVLAHTPAYADLMNRYPKAKLVKDHFIENIDPEQGGLGLVLGWSRISKTTTVEGLAAELRVNKMLNKRIKATGRMVRPVHISGGEEIPKACESHGIPFLGDYFVLLKHPEIAETATQNFLSKIHKAFEANDENNTVVVIAEYMPLPSVLELIRINPRLVHAVFGLLTNLELQKIGADMQEAINKENRKELVKKAKLHRQEFYRTSFNEAIGYLKYQQGNSSAVEVSMAIGNKVMAELANEFVPPGVTPHKLAQLEGITPVDLLNNPELRAKAEQFYYEDVFERYGISPENSFIGKPEVVEGKNYSHPRFRKKLKPQNL